MNMKHEYDHDELIDLGAASVETKGPGGNVSDTEGNFIPLAGLSDE